MSEWYYTNNRQQLGPVSSQELKKLADSGTLKPSDLVWRDGMASWVKAESAKGLFGASTPKAGSTPKAVAATTMDDEPEYAEEVEDDAEVKPRRRRTSADEDDGRPRRRSGADEVEEADDDRSRRRKRRADYDDDYDEDRPRRRRRAKQTSGAGLKIALAVGGGLLALVAIIVVVVLLASSGGGTGPRNFNLAQGRNTWWNISFKPQHRVDVRVVSNGQSDVDLFVYDGNNNRVAVDEGDSKDCFVSFIAQGNQRYKVEVQNRVRIDQPDRNGANSGTVTFTETPAALAQNKPPVPPVVNPPGINPPVGNPPVGNPPVVNPPVFNPQKFNLKNFKDNLPATALAEGSVPVKSSIAAGDPRDRFNRPTKVYTYPMVQGKTYTITMDSVPIDSFLIVVDPNGNLAGIDDDGGDGLNSRLVIRASVTGAYRIYASSLTGRFGDFTLNVQAN